MQKMVGVIGLESERLRRIITHDTDPTFITITCRWFLWKEDSLAPCASKILFNSFCCNSCKRKVECCGNRKIPAVVMPMLLKYKIFNNFTVHYFVRHWTFHICQSNVTTMVFNICMTVGRGIYRPLLTSNKDAQCIKIGSEYNRYAHYLEIVLLLICICVRLL